MVPAVSADEGLIEAGLARPVLLRVQPPVEELLPWGRCRLRLGRVPGSVTGLVVVFAVRGSADVGLAVLVRLRHSPVAAAEGGGGRRRGPW